MIGEGKIVFKFRSEKDSDEVMFSGSAVTLDNLKALIEEKKSSKLKRKAVWIGML